MNNEEMLEKMRLDRPEQLIHEVISYEKNKYGFYNVKVNMEGRFFETIVKHTISVLPYPMNDFHALSQKDKKEWINNSI